MSQAGFDLRARSGGLALVLAPALILALVCPVAAEKTDVVVFKNGDRLTGEVKKLERGKLSFKTDTTETIQIQWSDVARVQGSETFDVELDTGERYLGSLAPASEEGRLVVVGEEESWTLDLVAVVRLTPIEDSFWKRLDGYFDLGFSFTETDDRTQLSFGAGVSYRTPKYLRKLTLSTIQASQREVDVTDRQDLSLQVTRFPLQSKRLLIMLANLQRNEELGIDLRTLVGAGAGWRVIQSNSAILTLTAGGAVTEENLDGAEPSQANVEALLGLQFQSFRFDHPERDIDVALTVFPSASDFGRVRAELRAKVRWEIARDFFLSLTLLESFDSEPPTEDASETDLSFTTSVGWSF